MVEGYVPTTQDEIGVVVNGVIAQVSGDGFVANNVPLVPGENTITAIAADFEGNTTADSVVVNSIGANKSVELVANVESGIAPFEVDYLLIKSLNRSIVRYTLDLDGDSVPEVDLPQIPEFFTHTYSTPGLHYATVTLTDDTGNTYSDTIAINAVSYEWLSGLFENRWEAAKATLINGNIQGGLEYFSQDVREKYEQGFSLLGDSLPERLTGIEAFNLMDGSGRIIEAELIRSFNGVAYSFPFTWVQGTQGLWRIKGF